jgi:Domain of unknown function (DUF4372)
MRVRTLPPLGDGNFAEQAGNGRYLRIPSVERTDYQRRLKVDLTRSPSRQRMAAMCACCRTVRTSCASLLQRTEVRHGLCLNRRTALILLGSRRLRINWKEERMNAVRHQNSIFHGVLKHVPWASLDRLVEKHEAGRDPRSLQARAHLVAMLYAQLSGSRSLRDIETSLKSLSRISASG